MMCTCGENLQYGEIDNRGVWRIERFFCPFCNRKYERRTRKTDIIYDEIEEVDE